MKNTRLIFVSAAVIVLCMTTCIFLYSWFSHSTLALTPSPTLAQSADNKLNINTATIKQLDDLPGIGEKTAKAIVAYRKENGNFTSIGQLANVPGMGAGRLDAIVDLITVGG